ncbi:MAG: hypothetical protein Q8M07_24260 [Prosthecobacter sp.]|nr:hypothetical protein [Prosthecobacter sp.]
MNASRGHLRFIADGRESFQELRRDEIREELLHKHARELHAAHFPRRWWLRWQIEREATRRAVAKEPSNRALFVMQR